MGQSYLNGGVLVLNKLWQPISVQSVATALVKVWSDSARIVDTHNYSQYTWSDWANIRPTENDKYIQLVNMAIKVPEVVTLVDYSNVPDLTVSFSRINLFTRDKWTCQYCGRRISNNEITIDHVTPKSRGGKSNFENCVAACISCNFKKADKTLQQAGMKLRTVPKIPRWLPTYHHGGVILDSWEKFVSEIYWNIPLEE